MTGIVALIVMPLILFMIFVAPIWLILSYRSKRMVNQGLSEEEATRLKQLAERAEQLSQRVAVLEKLLDQDSPEWRDKV